MPIYTYVCRDCGEKFDLLIGITSEKPEMKCKKCGSINIQKLLTSFSTISSGGKSNPPASSCPTGTCPTCF